MSLVSCNFLDVIPEGKATIDDLYKTHIQTDKFACSLYWYMPNRYYFQSSLEICNGDMMSGFFGSGRNLTLIQISRSRRYAMCR